MGGAQGKNNAMPAIFPLLIVIMWENLSLKFGNDILTRFKMADLQIWICSFSSILCYRKETFNLWRSDICITPGITFTLCPALLKNVILLYTEAGGDTILTQTVCRKIVFFSDESMFWCVCVLLEFIFTPFPMQIDL